MYPSHPQKNRTELALALTDFIFWADPCRDPAEEWETTFNALNVVPRSNPATPYTLTLVEKESLYKLELYHFALEVIRADIKHGRLFSYPYSPTQWKLRATEKNPNYSYQQHVMRLYTKHVGEFPNGDEIDNPIAKKFSVKTEAGNG